MASSASLGFREWLVDPSGRSEVRPDLWDVGSPPKCRAVGQARQAEGPATFDSVVGDSSEYWCNPVAERSYWPAPTVGSDTGFGARCDGPKAFVSIRTRHLGLCIGDNVDSSMAKGVVPVVGHGLGGWIFQDWVRRSLAQ